VFVCCKQISAPETPAKFMKRDLKLYRDSGFSLSCEACGRCCHNKKIQLNPYEIVRMADYLGIGTGEFLTRYMMTDEPFLQMQASRACVFLAAGKCTVHPARPLVCRLYPLGQHLNGAGAEHFTCVTPEKTCESRVGERSTVDRFLVVNDTEPYMEASRKYLELFYRFYESMVRQLQQRDDIDLDLGAYQSKVLMEEWFDVDKVVAAYCQAEEKSAPADLSGRVQLHIEALGARFGSGSEVS